MRGTELQGMERLKQGQTVERWTLTRRIADHVWHVTNKEGEAGVLKTQRHPGKKAAKRFRAEVEGLQSLSGVHGVLPLLDRDILEQPQWFVMPPAELLDVHLDAESFDATVAAVAQLAEVLADLQKRSDPVAHRDIKPNNLFWYGDEPVFGDFGIAAWVGAVGVTGTKEMIGPLAFLAPEAMEAAAVKNWHAADVYSLAKSLWSLAAPRRPTWPGGPTARPPQGPIADREHSLAGFGGKAAAELDPVLRLATDNRPTARPSAAKFAQELRSWLRQHPGTHPRLPAHAHRVSGGFLGLEGVRRILERSDAESNEVGRKLIAMLRGELGRFEVDDSPPNRSELDEDGSHKTAAIMDSHGRHTEDAWERAFVVRLQSPLASVRLVVGAVFNTSDDFDFIVERHHREPGGSWILDLADEAGNLHPELVTTREQMSDLITRVTGDLATREPTRWSVDRIL